jgi:GT2 family glycosyltransferase
MDISFVLLTWNSEKYIERCLESLLADIRGRGMSYEIFIVDNGSTDNTASVLKMFQSRYPDRIKLICLNRNTGTTYSRNLALKQASGKYIVIMDSDVELIHKGTLSDLIKLLEMDEHFGLAAPRLLYPSGSLQKSTDIFPTVFTKIFRYFFLKLIEKRESRLPQKIQPYPVDYAISAVWVIKKDVMKTVGLLDENIFYSPEDVDYCLRLWKSGYKIIYEPRVPVIHHTQEISRGFKLNSAMLNHIKGLIYYFRKHGYFLKRPVSLSDQK